MESVNAPLPRVGESRKTLSEADRIGREGYKEFASLRSKNCFFLFRRRLLRAERRQVAALRSVTPPLRSGPSGDCARRFAKKAAQEEKTKESHPFF